MPFCLSAFRFTYLSVSLSLPPASLRVSSVSVVRSDHSSICVSWRPVSTVDGYRIVIQSVKGNCKIYSNWQLWVHKAVSEATLTTVGFTHWCVNVYVCLVFRQANKGRNCRRVQQQSLFHWSGTRDSVSHQCALAAQLSRGRCRLHSPSNRSDLITVTSTVC